MKVAITADVHLKSKDKTPKRWQALEDILKQLPPGKIKDLIIAGDLFDAESHNYSQFDRLCKDKKFKKINIHILPGNHDQGISQVNFIAENIRVYDQPEIIDLNGLKFFFVPYLEDKTMANVLSQHDQQLNPPWVLIGHGNWSETIRSQNPVEPGVYMSLSRAVLKQYQPSLTILGHIHKKMDNTDHNVFYPGSPCGLDITETGKRSFIVLNLDNLQVDRQELEPDVIYFDETIMIYPLEDEQKHWQEIAEKLKQKWGLSGKEKNKAVIRLNIVGFSTNKWKLKKFFEQEFKEFKGWKNNKIDVSQLNSASDNYELLNISRRIIKKINDLDLEPEQNEPTKNEIIVQAMETVYVK